MVVAVATSFGEDSHGIVDVLLDQQLDDGGWNCDIDRGSTRSSFHSTICVLEGLLAYERAGRTTPEVTAARRRGEEYLLKRRMLRRLSTGEIPDSDWTRFSFPPRWFYDALRALDYFRAAGSSPDPRMDEALNLVRSKRDTSGRWALENTHPGKVHFEMEGEGEPSRWNTLRALRVLRWASA
jgi:hypothetical protein